MCTINKKTFRSLRKLNWLFVKFLYEKINHTIDIAIFFVTNIGKETCFERLHS
jgi:hypothetical protein